MEASQGAEQEREGAMEYKKTPCRWKGFRGLGFRGLGQNSEPASGTGTPGDQFYRRHPSWLSQTDLLVIISAA